MQLKLSPTVASGTLQALEGHAWLVATVLDHTDTELPHLPGTFHRTICSKSQVPCPFLLCAPPHQNGS